MFEDNRISSMDFGAMSDAGLIDALRTAQGAVAVAQAAEVFAVRELYRRRRAESVEPGPDGVRAGEFAAAEVAVALRVEEGTAGALIDIGLALEESLPRVRAAFAAGRVDLAKVRVIVDCTRGLAEELVGVLEPRLLEAAGRIDPGRLRQTARRWVARVDPGGAQRRRERRQSERDVRIRAVQDGMALFDGLLPAPGAQTVAMRLREMSLQVCPRDPRTMAQRRADALVALADGSGRLRCRCERGVRCPVSRVPIEAPRRALIQVGISAEALFGLREAPGFLAGYGPIDAALARLLAEHARFQAIPEDGPEEEAAARHSTRAVDGFCRFPGCVMPAAESGSAHGAGGSVSLCSRHGRLKALADKGRTGWRVFRAGRDRLRWTTPTGETHTTVREGARYLFPHTDIEAPVVPPALTGRIEAATVETMASKDRPTAEDLGYPLAGHVPVRRQLSRLAPEDDIPDRDR
ncbi:DUF222 domain-containing protein [Nocardia bovistercoris]|uniref:DUF222 domain-containing protein n=1 Tax=Nocardia bovistercoris TaxID=2785916 RepID=A0A931N127_9NOCA|nr:DUF222 domain-containing protein [Nocardia bovistercoris]MBH0775564.1 DUF222 domain-containing protein [Nocardia bovistercoris]